MNDEIRNFIRGEIARAVRTLIAEPRTGTIVGFDPNRYMAKVKVSPEGDFPLGTDEQGITGWIPIGSDWVGNGWGDFAPPNLGDQVSIIAIENEPAACYVDRRFFTAKNLPVAVQTGERLIQHESGSYIHFKNDGSITLWAATKLILHGVNETALDAGGTGVVYQPAQITSYTSGVPVSTVAPDPPQVPD